MLMTSLPPTRACRPELAGRIRYADSLAGASLIRGMRALAYEEALSSIRYLLRRYEAHERTELAAFSHARHF